MFLIVRLVWSILKNRNPNVNDEAQSTQSEESVNSDEVFPEEAFDSLEKKVYSDRWSIPYKSKRENVKFIRKTNFR